MAKALFANHTATGFFFGDELVGGGGLPLTSLVLATDRVRADFPVAQNPEAILFENEAAHIFLWQPEDGHGGPNRWANFTEWPRSLTHVSVDIYHFLPQGHAPILCAHGQFNCTAECIPTPSTPAWSAKVKGKDCASAVRLFYEEQLYPRMAPHQKAVPRGARKVAPPLDHPVVVAPRLVEHDAEPLPTRVRDGPDVVDDAHVFQALVREEEPRHGALLHQVHAAAHLERH